MIVDSLECSICLQNFIHPAQLPCGHIFCFLCIKGCAFHRLKCPMCRSRFSSRFFDDPKLVNVWVKSEKDRLDEINQLVDSCECLSIRPQQSAAVEEGDASTSNHQCSNYAWFYEGFQGWWQYDERTCYELENAFNKQLPSHELTIAGYIYVIDLKNMTQIRKDRSGRLRRIKRDLVTCEKKGVAGIKLSSIQASGSDTISKTPRCDEASVSNSNTLPTTTTSSCNPPSNSSASTSNPGSSTHDTNSAVGRVLRSSRSRTPHSLGNTSTGLAYTADAVHRSISSGPRNQSDTSSTTTSPSSSAVESHNQHT
ncbi:unnamed protein product [Trichobilharzia szidati]|nr:unnamed protein product [Trichobilharzia szidati]